MVTVKQIRAMRDEAEVAGDEVAVATCDAAMDRWESVADTVAHMGESERHHFERLDLDGSYLKARAIVGTWIGEAAAQR